MTSIPRQAWTRRLDRNLANPGKAGVSLDLIPVLKLLPMAYRMYRYLLRMRSAGFEAGMNVFHSPVPGPVAGVPLGGIGGGSIGRGWRGEFNRWCMRPGFPYHDTVHADQFSLFVQRGQQPPCSLALTSVKPPRKILSSWSWDLDPACATYYGLFPRAWTVYEEPLPGVHLTCQQISPFIPHNYKESSFPVAVFEWTIHNTGEDPAAIALMFSFQNGTGRPNDLAGGHYNEPFVGSDGRRKSRGIILHHVHRQVKTRPFDAPSREPFEVLSAPLSFALATPEAADRQVTFACHFDPLGDGSAIWRDFSSDGMLSDQQDPVPSQEKEAIAAALAVRVKLPPGGSASIPFSLAWDMPTVYSGVGTAYHPRYTVFYGSRGEAAPAMACDALQHYPAWIKAIEKWQKTILEDPKLPDWYKSALFNELYYITHGGSFWGYPAKEKPDANRMGHFGYLEGHEYRMVNTYDVHFNASIALLMLFPRIELSLQRDFARTVPQQSNLRYLAASENEWAFRKVKGAVPHDLGWPDEDPWVILNGYPLHDTSKWKDLNSKFVLMVFRDAVFTKDRAFLAEVWPAVVEAIDYMLQFDRDGDGLIENDFADQTYDAWVVKGPSAYTGNLWLACLHAAAWMARRLGKRTDALKYERMCTAAVKAYEEKLWNGNYYDYDSSHSQHHDSIMADQLAGHGFLRMAGLPGVQPAAHVRSALRTIYARNVLGVQGGAVGALNGIRPDGSIDHSSMQAHEIWAGTTYSLAALMIHEGMPAEAFQTARGIYHMTYEEKGYWYSTPEAWTLKGDFRSLTYMRPLAIWAMQHAWRSIRKRKRTT
jgi:non-lysosomal glucosylceramidase